MMNEVEERMEGLMRRRENRRRGRERKKVKGKRRNM
jgi:hypothetical protein